jgi:hypothetical protein
MSNFQAWALDVGVRAIKTAAQTAVALLIGNTSGLLSVDWANVGSLAGFAAVVCVLQNLTTLNLTSQPVVAVPVAHAPMSVTPPAQPATIFEPPAAETTQIVLPPVTSGVYTAPTDLSASVQAGL